jgi:hypothetical protein
MRLRVIAVLFVLLGAPARAEDIAKPTLVTLKLADVPPQQAFDELAKSSGVEFVSPPRFWQRESPSVGLDFDHQPFWLALKDLCAKTGVSLKYETNAPKPRILLSRDNPGWTQYPSVSSGPFLISLIGLQRSSTVDMRQPDDVRRSFIARFSIFCEPRVRLLRGSLLAKIEEAVDDKGHSLVPKEKDPDGDTLNFVTSWSYTLEAKLDYPKEAGTKIPKLRAWANFIAQTASETIEVPIDDVRAFKDVSRSVAGRKITFRELRRTDQEWEAVVTFARETLPPEQWENAVFPGHTLALHDGQNQSITARGFGLASKSDQATFVFKFEKDTTKGPKIGRPVKFTWEVPTQTQSLPLNFEFKDVTLP